MISYDGKSCRPGVAATACRGGKYAGPALDKVLSDPEKSRELRRRLRHQELNEKHF